MPVFESGDAHIYYEEHGNGFPLLLLAPGGMRSSIAVWERAPWHPIRELAGEFRVIAMDQRNAGRSRAPVAAGDGWHSYAEDQRALLDHLGIERCHVLGGCIGGSFGFGLIERARERVVSAVLQQPIGLRENRQVFYDLFDGWAAELATLESPPPIDTQALPVMRERFYGTGAAGGDFVFSVSREFVRGCQVPLLVLMGEDIYHPSEISREIVELAPQAELIERWKDPESCPHAVARVRSFLHAHTPA
jgi:pimeloyl-ACP methyl ester carboxylesterase